MARYADNWIVLDVAQSGGVWVPREELPELDLAGSPDYAPAPTVPPPTLRPRPAAPVIPVIAPTVCVQSIAASACTGSAAQANVELRAAETSAQLRYETTQPQVDATATAWAA